MWIFLRCHFVHMCFGLCPVFFSCLVGAHHLTVNDISIDVEFFFAVIYPCCVCVSVCNRVSYSCYLVFECKTNSLSIWKCSVRSHSCYMCRFAVVVLAILRASICIFRDIKWQLIESNHFEGTCFVCEQWNQRK